MHDPAARFAEAALRLSGHCALMMGWRPDEFWAATPAEVHAIFAAMRGSPDVAGIDRNDLQRLMEQDDG